MKKETSALENGDLYYKDTPRKFSTDLSEGAISRIPCDKVTLHEGTTKAEFHHHTRRSVQGMWSLHLKYKQNNCSNLNDVIIEFPEFRGRQKVVWR